MSRYLVTGLGGSGKSTINEQLNKWGYLSYDTDKIKGLARWEDLKTGEVTEVDHSGFVDFTKVDWNWDGRVLKNFLRRHNSLFLCGSAGNQFDFHPLFDKVFLLMLDPETHKQHLAHRTDGYGSDTEMVEWILAEQPVFAAKVIELGGIAIDATQQPENVTREIIRKADG